MTIGVIGLGRMGLAIARRLRDAQHHVVGFDPSEKAQQEAQHWGISTVPEVERVAKISNTIWLMVPAGDLIDDILAKITPSLSAGSIIIDGGNSNFVHSIARARMLSDKEHHFLDCGTSGGVRGLEDGFCLMVGGSYTAYQTIEHLFKAIAAPGGYLYVGPSGSGHYVKMVHNGIEYGLMQAYAEGLHVIKEGTFKDVPIDLAQLTLVWNQSSVIRSFLLGLTHEILSQDSLENVSGVVAESGMGQWTLQEAQKHNIAVPALEQALAVRAKSRQTGGDYSTQLLAMMRYKFGGHSVEKKVNDENN